MFDLITAAEKAISGNEKEFQYLLANSNEDNCEEIAWGLIRKYYISKHDLHYSKEKILEMYDNQKGIPTIDNITDDIDEYNTICIDKAVEIMIEKGCPIANRNIYESEESYISDSYSLWYDYFYSSLSYEGYSFELSEQDIMKILLSENKTFIAASYDECYDILGSDYGKELLINDCQRQLFPEFSIAGELAKTIGQDALFGYINARYIRKEETLKYGELRKLLSRRETLG